MRPVISTICVIAAASVLAGCSMASKGRIRKIQRENIVAELQMPVDDRDMYGGEDEEEEYVNSDTLTIETENGQRVFFMNATVDSTGTLHAAQELQGIVVTARFKNIPERNGQVQLAFDVSVPQGLIHTSWQVRLKPSAVLMEDTLGFDEVHITGQNYRDRQMRGYELYNRFLASIITDTTELLYMDYLEAFIERNIPKLAKLKLDSAIVSNDSISGLWGVSLREAVQHYRKGIAIAQNNMRRSMREKKYAQFVKDPYIYNGVRVDTIITDSRQSVMYYYTQGVPTRSGLRKIDIYLEGGIYQNGEKLYSIPSSEPLTFYVSSFATLAEHKEKFLTKIIEKKAYVNNSAYIVFKAGKYQIDTTLAANRDEMSRIKGNIAELIENEEFYIDSLLITASCSPEGSYSLNSTLARKRGEQIAGYFKRYIGSYQRAVDSAERERLGVILTMGEIDVDEGVDGDGDVGVDADVDADVDDGVGEDLGVDELDIRPSKERFYDFEFIVKHNSEDWDGLRALIRQDSVLEDKAAILEVFKESDPDRRERKLAAMPEYKYIKQHLYPELRQVRFDFHLHRRGMIKDTIHTTVPDTVYRAGLEAIERRDFKTAVQHLGQYRDINSALAFIAMDYNASALSVLEDLPKSSKRDYMMAIAYSRTGNEKLAVQYYISSVEQDRSMRSRGNLDPEISRLIQKYNIEFD